MAHIKKQVRRNTVIPADLPLLSAGAPGEDRTRGLLIRSETLYPLSYERMLQGLKHLQLLLSNIVYIHKDGGLADIGNCAL